MKWSTKLGFIALALFVIAQLTVFQNSWIASTGRVRATLEVEVDGRILQASQVWESTETRPLIHRLYNFPRRTNRFFGDAIALNLGERGVVCVIFRGIGSRSPADDPAYRLSGPKLEILSAYISGGSPQPGFTSAVAIAEKHRSWWHVDRTDRLALLENLLMLRNFEAERSVEPYAMIWVPDPRDFKSARHIDALSFTRLLGEQYRFRRVYFVATDAPVTRTITKDLPIDWSTFAPPAPYLSDPPVPAWRHIEKHDFRRD